LLVYRKSSAAKLVISNLSKNIWYKQPYSAVASAWTTHWPNKPWSSVLCKNTT